MLLAWDFELLQGKALTKDPVRSEGPLGFRLKFGTFSCIPELVRIQDLCCQASRSVWMLRCT